MKLLGELLPNGQLKDPDDKIRNFDNLMIELHTYPIISSRQEESG